MDIDSDMLVQCGENKNEPAIWELFYNLFMVIWGFPKTKESKKMVGWRMTRATPILGNLYMFNRIFCGRFQIVNGVQFMGDIYWDCRGRKNPTEIVPGIKSIWRQLPAKSLNFSHPPSHSKKKHPHSMHGP